MDNSINKYKKHFSQSLSKFIKAGKFSQEEVANKLRQKGIDVNRSAVSRWENGVSLPRIDCVYALTQVFNCSMKDLLGDL